MNKHFTDKQKEIIDRLIKTAINTLSEQCTNDWNKKVELLRKLYNELSPKLDIKDGLIKALKDELANLETILFQILFFLSHGITTELMFFFTCGTKTNCFVFVPWSKIGSNSFFVPSLIYPNLHLMCEKTKFLF